MYMYLKKTLLCKKSILIYMLLSVVMIYNFIDADKADFINFTVYDTAVGFFARIGAFMIAYLFLIYILISYYDKNYIIVRFKDIERWRNFIIKSQIFLAIIFTLIINIIPFIFILMNFKLIGNENILIFMLFNMVTQAGAFAASGLFVSFLYFKTMNLKSSIVIPFIVYMILNLSDIFLLDRYFQVSSCFAMPSNASSLVIFQVCRKTLIIALVFYLMNTSIKKKRDLYNFDD